jgi:hypothetical protein
MMAPVRHAWLENSQSTRATLPTSKNEGQDHSLAGGNPHSTGHQPSDRGRRGVLAVSDTVSAVPNGRLKPAAFLLTETGCAA